MPPPAAPLQGCADCSVMEDDAIPDRDMVLALLAMPPPPPPPLPPAVASSVSISLAIECSELRLEILEPNWPEGTVRPRWWGPGVSIS